MTARAHTAHGTTQSYGNTSGRKTKKPSPKEQIEALPVEQEAGDLSVFEALHDAQNAAERNETVSDIGKELARVRGAQIVADMLSNSSLSLREIEEKYDFAAAALSKMANAKTLTGPTLWKVFALAEALGYVIDISLKKK
jgi:hypothetical protein